MRISRFRSVIWIIFCALLLNCAHQARVPKQETVEKSSDLSLLFPTERQIPDLARPHPPKSIPVEGYAIYLGARCERYIAYHVKEIVIASYFLKSSALKAPAADMEIIRFGSPEDAYGAFSVERPPIGENARILDQGYIASTKAGFWAGDLYVRILSPNDYSDNTRALTMVAEIARRSLPKGPDKLAAFDRFPVPLRLPSSEIFVRQRVIGYSFLTNGYLVDFNFGGRIATAFFCIHKDAVMAEESFQALFERLIAKNAQVVPMSGLGDRAFLARRTRHGNIAIFQRGRYLAGLLATPPVIGDFLKDFDTLLKSNP